MIDVKYFMDELEEWEAQDIIDCIPYSDKALWECTRGQMYMVAQINSKKKLKPTDIFKFAWDDELKNTSISNTEIERLRQRAKLIGQQK